MQAIEFAACDDSWCRGSSFFELNWHWGAITIFAWVVAQVIWD